MGASPRHVIVVALQIDDDASYAEYRTNMGPILLEYGGQFDFDLEVSKMLRGPTDAAVNRVFALSFPDRPTRQRFFSDARYKQVRAQYFDAAVRTTVRLAEYATEPSNA